MSDRAILVHANRIHELSERLDSAASADSVQPEQLADAKIVREARWLLEDFAEGGHVLNDALIGDEGPQAKRDAQAQVRALRAFVKQFGK